MLHSICQQIWKSQQWPQDWKRSVFIPVPKKGNAKECPNYCTIALISHTSKIMLRILQARLQQYVNCELPEVQAGFEKAEEPEIKLPTSAGSWKKQESSRKTSTSALLTMPKPLTVWITINCGKFWEMGISDHLTCLLRNLYAGQVVWYSHLFQNFPHFIVIHTVKGFGIVNKAEIDVFVFFFFPGDLLLFPWSSRCWQFDLWFLCLF